MHFTLSYPKAENLGKSHEIKSSLTLDFVQTALTPPLFLDMFEKHFFFFVIFVQMVTLIGNWDTFLLHFKLFLGVKKNYAVMRLNK